MLFEEQAAELLRRCEVIAGRRLDQVRGNLRKASTRAEAVWELLVLEAVAALGPTTCEPPSGGPDIRLMLPTGRHVSIEVTYVHPRAEDSEHRCQLIRQWMHQVSTLLPPPAVVFECDFFETDRTEAGPVLKLPAEHERRAFLGHPEVAEFIASVKANPTAQHHKKLSAYSVSLRSRPKRSETDTMTSSSSPALDAPTSVEEHAGYRALRAKLSQHRVNEPYVICIGSDVSRVLRAQGGFGREVSVINAFRATLRPSSRLSAILLVSIESRHTGMGGFEREARVQLMPVDGCQHPLFAEELAALATINLNRWRYTFPLSVREPKPQHRLVSVTGPLSFGYTAMGSVKIAIPASVVIDALSGRKPLVGRYGGGDGWFDEQIARFLGEGWSIIGCTFKAGNLERGLGGSVEFEIAPPHDPVFWDTVKFGKE